MSLCVNIFWLIHIGLLEMFQNTFLNLTLRSGTFQEIFKINGQNQQQRWYMLFICGYVFKALTYHYLWKQQDAYADLL